MNLYQKKRRTPVLQIISMIDILIILLIFLVVSTSFKDPRSKARQAQATARSVLNVSVPVSEAMNLGTDTSNRVSLTVTKEGKFFLSDVEVPLDRLAESLKVFKQSSPAKLDLRVDEAVPWGTMIKTWDALTKAGYKVGDVPTLVNRPGGAR